MCARFCILKTSTCHLHVQSCVGGHVSADPCTPPPTAPHPRFARGGRRTTTSASASQRLGCGSDRVPAAALTAPRGRRIGLSDRCRDRTCALRHVRPPRTAQETELGHLVAMETAGRQQLLTPMPISSQSFCVSKVRCQGNAQPWLRLSNESQTESKKSDSAEFYGSERCCWWRCVLLSG